MRDNEQSIRRGLLIAASLLWAASLIISWLIIAKVIDQIKHPGMGLIVFMAQGLAITLTVVWAQFRSRRVMIEVLKAGVRLAAAESAAAHELPQQAHDLDT